MNFLFPDYFSAGLSSTSIESLKELAASQCEKIRARVAENEATSEAVLELLMQDNSSNVRASLALNPKASKAMLKRLASDACPDVRLAIAENPYIPIATLIALTADENPYVALRAERTIEAIVDEGADSRRGIDISVVPIKKTMTRMLKSKARLTKSDALHLKELIFADGYFSRSEKKMVVQSIKRGLLDDQASAIFRDVLLHGYAAENHARAIA